VDKRETDWEAIEVEYRANQLSNVMLGKKYGVSEGAIRKRAKAEGWTRDLTAKVRAKVRDTLVRGEVRDPKARDNEIVDVVAATGAQVVRTHRKDIRTAADLVGMLMGQLMDAAQNRDEIEGAIDDETADDDTTARRSRMKRAISLPTHAATIRDLTTAAKNLVALERQAYNLDETNMEETYEERLARLMGK